MKRIISLLLAILIFSSLPVTAMASGDEDYVTGTLVSTSEELENALADSSDNILISSEFTWGDDDKTLIIDFNDNEKTDYGSNAPRIVLMGNWTIPQDWTVICYEHLYFAEYGQGVDITVNGSFFFMDKAVFQTSYSSVQLTVNGYFATSSTSQTNLNGLKSITINGQFENLNACNVPDVTINSGGKWSITGGNVWANGDLTLADGVVLSGKELSVSGNITASGSVTFDCTVLTREDASLSGDLSIKQFGHRGKDSVVTIPAGSKVHMEDLLYWDGIRVNVAGELSFGGSYQGIDNSTIHLEKSGSLILPPWIQLGSADGGSVIDGTGTLKLFAEPHPVYDTFNGHPRLFGLDSNRGISDCVASTVTVWRNWADCVHNWVETGVVVAPTCGTQGYTERACSVCGTKSKINIKEPSGAHNLSYAPSQWSESEVEVSCSGCGLTNEVYIYVEADKAEFKDVPVEIAHVRCSGNLIAEEDLPQIVYSNNDKMGTATASAEIGGYTISTTFQIVACAHEVGTPATCQKPAVCGKCGESFGSVKDHTWGDTLSYNEKTHYFTCTVDGCGATTSSEEELYGILDSALIEKWAICMEMGMVNGGEYIPLTDHVYETGSNVCAVCGGTKGESQEHTHSWNSATCTDPKTCKTCGATEGKAKGHSWNNATCTAPKTCSVCKATEGKKLEHAYTDKNDATCNVCGYTRQLEQTETKTIPVYRLYNPYTYEHLLTGGEAEKDLLLSIGWSLDGVAWEAPVDGIPVYRLYNPYDDWHTYTISEAERDTMVAAGWTVDGVVSRGYDGPNGRLIYRLFNPYVQTNFHLFTAGVDERDLLVNAGWILEGVAWSAVK